MISGYQVKKDYIITVENGSIPGSLCYNEKTMGINSGKGALVQDKE